MSVSLGLRPTTFYLLTLSLLLPRSLSRFHCALQLLSSAMTTSQAASEALDTVHRLLGSRIRVTMTDGRIASGKFINLDRLGNIMLEDVVETRLLEYHDVPAADTKDTSLNKKEANSDEINNAAQQHVQFTKDENGVCQWTTERSVTQAVIIGSKVSKVEMMKQELEARLGEIDC